MFDFVSPVVRFFGGRVTNRFKCLFIVFVFAAACARGQEQWKVPISFLPPPLENATYSLGVYEAKSGKLVRRLQEIAPESAFTVGLNGLMTNWDGKDDAGKPVIPGRYMAHGYAVGPLKVDGVAILGNDWAKDEEALRVRTVEAITLVPVDEGLATVVKVGDRYELLRYAGTDGILLWHKPLGISLAVPQTRIVYPLCSLVVQGDNLVVTSLKHQTWTCHVSDGESVTTPTKSLAEVDETSVARSAGKDNTLWKIEDELLVQTSSSGEVLRRLTQAVGEPKPIGVAASSKSEKLYVLERSGTSSQQVRGLSWIATSAENGQQVSTWQTFFERRIHPPDPLLGLEAAWVAHLPSPTVEIVLVENPLSPDKPQQVKLTASTDENGSFLATGDGLHLRQISQRAGLHAVKLTKGKTADSLTFFQTDGAAWDEFSITGAKNLLEFDAGDIEMTADGEKAHPAKAAEPPDL